ncbi:helix-turn-helix domain-containing protein [Gemmatimonadota bacterium]
MNSTRLGRIPESMRRELREARRRQGWSQQELGRRVGLPQAHISQLETGRTVPQFDTLLDLVRVLGYDLLLIPRALVPAVHGLVGDYAAPLTLEGAAEGGQKPLYALTEPDNEVNRGTIPGGL